MPTNANIVPLPISNFRGFNSADPPQDLPMSQGRVCTNLFFDRGSLYPRAGYEKYTAGVDPTITGYAFNRACFARRLSGGGVEAFSAHGKATGVDDIWQWGNNPCDKRGQDLPSANDATHIGSFLEFNGRLLYGNGYTLHYYNRTLLGFIELAVARPAAPTAVDWGAGPGNLKGTYTYYIVERDPETGSMSIPSPSASVSVVDSKIIVTPPTPPNNILAPATGAPTSTLESRIYRKGGASTTIRYVATTTGGAAALDNLADENLGDEIVTNCDPFPDVSLMDIYHNRLLGAIKLTGTDEVDYIYLSYYGEPWRCPLVTDLTDPNDGARIQVGSSGSSNRVSALKSFGDVAVILTSKEGFILSGDDPATFQLTRAWTGVGCVAHRTLQQANGVLIWLGASDIWLWDGSAGRPISVSADIRDRILNWSDKSAAHAWVQDNRYFLTCNGEVFFLDLRQSGPDESGRYIWAWGEVTGWGSFAQIHVLPEDPAEPSSTIRPEHAYALSTNTVNGRVYKMLPSSGSDDGATIACRWVSGNLPREVTANSANGRTFFRLRRMSMLMDAIGGATGSAITVTLNFQVDGSPTDIETHTFTMTSLFVSGEEVCLFEEDVGADVQGRFFWMELEFPGVRDGATKKFHPVIHNMRPWIVAPR